MNVKRTIIGAGKAMDRLWQSIHKSAAADMTVLIQGESGTGKELVAHAIHAESRRAKGPFVALNCAGIQETLVESELFGHEKGSFTGAATMKIGRFEQADHGTLFLDEIGEISPTVQVKLLRVLQEKEVDRIGGRAPLKVDFRLITATNKDLQKMSATGKYREDLYFRLCADLVRTPALRDRLEDIRELGLYFALRCERPATRALKGISQEVLDLFHNYPWPGNVREFQDVVQWAVRTSENAMLKIEDLPEWFLERAAPSSLGVQDHDEIVEQTSRRLCASALAAAQGNYSKAAKLLKLNRTTFFRLAKRHGLGSPTEEN